MPGKHLDKGTASEELRPPGCFLFSLSPWTHRKWKLVLSSGARLVLPKPSSANVV